VHKNLSTKLGRKTGREGDNFLSNWDEAITKAKLRIKEIKRSIRTFESLRDQGMEFPRSKRSSRKTRSRSTARKQLASTEK